MHIKVCVCLMVNAIIFGPPVHAQTEWPTRGWRNTTPSEVGLDSTALAALDADISNGKHGYIDSFLVIRHGLVAYERSYERDYDRIYGQEVKNHPALVVNDPSGPYSAGFAKAKPQRRGPKETTPSQP